MATNLLQDHVAVLMVPFPLQGHLNQLLHLSRLISARGVAVHYVGTATHNRQARRRAQGWDPVSASNIFFHEFPSLSFTAPPPDPTAAIKFPAHLQPLFDALHSLRRPVADLLHDLSASCRRVVVVYDSLMGSVVQDFVKFPNAESYIFHSVSAYTIFFFLWETNGRPFAVEPEILSGLPALDGCFTPEFLKFVVKQHKYLKINSGRIYNTCRVVEGPFLELLEKPHISGNKKQWALGPFNPIIAEKREPEFRHKCLKWLDRQARNSVILVSFGTTTTLSNHQIHELATGLEKSGQKFVWVLRDADSGDVFREAARKAQLPRGFEERVRERGLVVRDWAPQLEILGHSATGGFMSHCGWNSCMESISMGKPIAAWPMHSDQPRNTVLIARVLRIGLVVMDWARRAELVPARALEEAVRSLMASEEGEAMRKRAADLGAAVRDATEEGGSAHFEFDCFVSHITR
ncbi:zeatin O-glucosyltransferase-like [Salvia miltiorrhiza]|uniref:zeatin O-glucosyltransferase-like n=1 Tax=Salvia miltiorrhiza TaxID=226208 RepID=UPI0025AC0991|nr:zeatin O-glucosyltransferase-like [Salvia miltiorrhiza]